MRAKLLILLVFTLLLSVSASVYGGNKYCQKQVPAGSGNFTEMWRPNCAVTHWSCLPTGGSAALVIFTHDLDQTVQTDTITVFEDTPMNFWSHPDSVRVVRGSLATAILLVGGP